MIGFALALTSNVGPVAAQPPGPTEQHEVLKQDVGTWDAKMSFWAVPGADPMVSRGRETNELLDGGMWLISRFEGEVAGMPFTGMGTFGFDPEEGKYVGSWVDSLSPYMTQLKGDYDSDTRTLTCTARSRDLMSGEVSTAQHIARYHEDGTRSFEIHGQGPDGQVWKMLEIEFTRRDEQGAG